MAGPGPNCPGRAEEVVACYRRVWSLANSCAARSRGAASVANFMTPPQRLPVHVGLMSSRAFRPLRPARLRLPAHPGQPLRQTAPGSSAAVIGTLDGRTASSEAAQ